MLVKLSHISGRESRHPPNGSGGILVARRSASTTEFLVDGRCERIGGSPGFWLSLRILLMGRLLTPLATGPATEFVGGWLAPGRRLDVTEGEEDADGDCFMPLTAVWGNEGGGRLTFGGWDAGLETAVAIMATLAKPGRVEPASKWHAPQKCATSGKE